MQICDLERALKLFEYTNRDLVKNVIVDDFNSEESHIIINFYEDTNVRELTQKIKSFFLYLSEHKLSIEAPKLNKNQFSYMYNERDCLSYSFGIPSAYMDFNRDYIEALENNTLEQFKKDRTKRLKKEQNIKNINFIFQKTILDKYKKHINHFILNENNTYLFLQINYHNKQNGDLNAIFVRYPKKQYNFLLKNIKNIINFEEYKINSIEEQNIFTSYKKFYINFEEIKELNNPIKIENGFLKEIIENC